MLERRQDLVRAIGLLVMKRFKALAIEAPEAFWVAAKHVDVSDLHRVDLRPQPGLRRAEVRNPGRHRDPCTGQRHHRTRLTDQRRQSGGVLKGAGAAHFPLNRGARFSRNAAIPSRASAEPKTPMSASFSPSSPASSTPAAETCL